MGHNEDVVSAWGDVCDVPHWIGEKVHGIIYVETPLNQVGGWVELTFVETQKTVKKTQKKEEKIQKIIYFLNSEKTMKTSFYYFQKNDFWENRKHKN